MYTRNDSLLIVFIVVVLLAHAVLWNLVLFLFYVMAFVVSGLFYGMAFVVSGLLYGKSFGRSGRVALQPRSTSARRADVVPEHRSLVFPHTASAT